VATVGELETRVRDCINRPRVHHALYSNDLKGFFVVCSALDAIGDTTLAIDAYRGLQEAAIYGERYLRLYGLLQAFFIQQDAAQHILETLDLTCTESKDDLFYVREIRNSAIGHPTRREGRPKKNIPQTSHAIARNSMWQNGFMLMSNAESGQTEMTGVAIAELIEKQERGIAGILRVALEHLQTREEEHRMKYKDRQLAALFPATIDYYFEKLFAGCRREDGREFTSIHVDLLNDILVAFRAALTERGIIPAYSHVAYDVEDAEYPLAEYKKYIDGDPAGTLNEKSSRIFVFFLQHQFGVLLKYAQEFDEEYMEPVKTSVADSSTQSL
jgi:hypothetical protein